MRHLQESLGLDSSLIWYLYILTENVCAPLGFLIQRNTKCRSKPRHSSHCCLEQQCARSSTTVPWCLCPCLTPVWAVNAADTTTPRRDTELWYDSYYLKSATCSRSSQHHLCPVVQLEWKAWYWMLSLDLHPVSSIVLIYIFCFVQCI